MVKNIILALVIISIANVENLQAQGDGPRSHLLTPKGVWGVNAKYLNLNQNLSPNGDLLLPNADVTINSFPITAFHTLGIKNRIVQLLAMINPTTVSGQLDVPVGMVPTEFEENGFSDGFVGIKVGFTGSPSLSIQDFIQKEPSYSLYGYFRTWYSGSYDNTSLFNIGTNRFTLEFGLPMSIPLFKKNEKATWLEVFPSVKFFTNNSDENAAITDSEKTQNPLFLLENHLTHNFTKKLWLSVNLRYQIGGASKTNEISDENQINIFGGSFGLGYQIAPYLGANIDYGRQFFGKNNARSEMLRIGIVFTYAKIEKSN